MAWVAQAALLHKPKWLHLEPVRIGTVPVQSTHAGQVCSHARVSPCWSEYWDTHSPCLHLAVSHKLLYPGPASLGASLSSVVSGAHFLLLVAS